MCSHGIKCSFKDNPLLRLENFKHFEESIYPYLLHSTTASNEMWVIGEGGQGVTINSFFAASLLGFPPTDCVIVPEAPGPVLESLGELLHTGRFNTSS